MRRGKDDARGATRGAEYRAARHAGRSTIVTRSDRWSSRPRGRLDVVRRGIQESPDAFPGFSHTVVTLPSVEIDGCAL
jgi:hypothetical protein